MRNYRVSTLLFLLAAAIGATGAHAKPPTGPVRLTLLYNVSPDPSWAAGYKVLLYADARRNPGIGQEDIFATVRYPDSYSREAGQQFEFTVPDVRAGEKIIVQGYMCAEGTTDCYPSDADNPPSCSVEVRIRGNLKASCEPVFTWSGGDENGGVLCHAECW